MKDPKRISRRMEEKTAWVKFKGNVAHIWKELVRIFFVHFDKLVIFVCLLISLQYQADVFRVTFLVFYIMYAFLDVFERKRYMRMQVVLNLSILFVLYVLELIFLRDLTKLDEFA